MCTVGACVQRARCVRAACTMRACSVHSACVQCAQCVRAVCTVRPGFMHDVTNQLLLSMNLIIDLLTRQGELLIECNGSSLAW